MGLIEDFGHVFDPAQQAAIASRQRGIGAAIAPDSAYWRSGDFGQAGQDIVTRGQGILGHNVGANFEPMQAFQQGLSGLGQQAGAMYQNGGPAAAAALASAQADTANAGGGLGGLKKLASQSADNTEKVGQAATSERGQYASQAIQNTAAAAASKLQQSIIQAALNHANRSKNTQAQALVAQEGIAQQNIVNSLQAGANNAQNTVAMGGIQNQQNQQALGLSAAEGVLAAGGGAAAYGVQSPAPAAPGIEMTGDAQNVNYTGGDISTLPGNDVDDANVPEAAQPAYQTAYGPAATTPEDAWYAALTKAQSQDQSAYQVYRG